MKQTLSIILTLVLAITALTALPFSAQAANIVRTEIDAPDYINPGDDVTVNYFVTYDSVPTSDDWSNLMFLNSLTSGGVPYQDYYVSGNTFVYSMTIPVSAEQAPGEVTFKISYLTSANIINTKSATAANFTKISKWADLKNALKNDGNYKLTADVAPTDAYWDDALSVPSGTSVVLDLNGHIVDRGYREDSTQLWDGSVIKTSGNLTVIDSNPKATHETPVTYTDPITGRELTVNGGILTGGHPDQYGGGVQVQGGTFDMKGGSIVNNIAGKNAFGAVAGLGGGVYIQSGNFNMSGGAIVGNKASNKNTMAPDTPLGAGGAVYIANGTFSFTGGLIRGNVAGEAGGGIYVDMNGTFAMTVGTLVGNYAPGNDNVYKEDGGSAPYFSALVLYSNDENEYYVRQHVVQGSTTPIATDIFAREGYDFVGWSEYDDGSGLTFADGADITYSPALLGGSKLYAQWQAYTFVDKVDPTCTEKGTKAHYKGVDGTLYLKDGETYTKVTDATALDIPAGHDYGTPTYSWNLENGVWKCTAERVCSRNADHKETETVEGVGAEKTPATCTVNGTTTYTATFTNAAFAQQTKDVDDIPALTHDWRYTIVWAMNYDEYTGKTTYYGATAFYVCNRVNNHVEHIEMQLSTDVQPATCTENGKTTYTAYISAADSLDGQEHTETQVVNEPFALGHSWGDPTYTWSQENGVWSCTAERVCANDASHIETETVAGTGAEKEGATCTENGTTTYTATFANAVFEQQAKDVDDIPALGHTMTHHEKVAATTTAPGVIEYWTCDECGGMFSDENGENEITDESELVIPAIIEYNVSGNGRFEWTKGSSESIVITVKRSYDDAACFDHYVKTLIDGKEVAVKAERGSTVVTISAAALEKLGTGKHTVSVVFDDGQADSSLTVSTAQASATATAAPAQDKALKSPNTGNGSIAVYFGFAALLLIAILATKKHGAKTDR